MFALMGLLLMFPIKCGLVVPEWAESSGIAARWHNAAVKELVRDELNIHRYNRIPKHFVHSAHARYGYAKRTDKYQRWKNRNRGKDVKLTTFRGSRKTGDYETSYGVGRLSGEANLDLVKSGRTKREVRQGASITVGGSGNQIRGRLTLKVPIAGSSGREMDFAAKLRLAASAKGRKRLAKSNAQARIDTVARTIREIEAIAPDEIKDMNERFARGYTARLNSRRTRRKR